MQPTTYADPADAFQAALDSGRSNPGIAATSDGTYAVCSRHTATKNGWEWLGRVYAQPPKTRSKKTVLGE